jgi:hypothetical protein
MPSLEWNVSITACVLEDESCRSVNFRKTSTYEGKENCEFLHAVDSENPELLYKDENFDYYILLQPKRVSIITRYAIMII